MKKRTLIIWLVLTLIMSFAISITALAQATEEVAEELDILEANFNSVTTDETQPIILIAEENLKSEEAIEEFVSAVAETEPVLEEIVVERLGAENTESENTVETTIPGENIEETTESDAEEEFDPDMFEYEGRQYVVPTISLNRDPVITESGYIEQITEVPHYFQSYYPKVRYGDSNLRKSGCGITCVAMVFSYLLDKEMSPADLAAEYTRYKVDGGSSYSLFPDSAEDYGITIEAQVYKWEPVVEALKEGKVVIANAKEKSVFTDGGHFIVLYGITEDGKILVKDPNLYNYSIWSNPILKEGFKNGFDEKSIKYHCFPCWIYQAKDVDAVAAAAEVA